MTDLAYPFAEALTAETADRAGIRPLSDARRGDRGVISHVGLHGGDDELERRLLELGFVEGAAIELIHEGLFGRDPIAVRLDDMRVALRRREARMVGVRFETIS